jgi:hypothetical protein
MGSLILSATMKGETLMYISGASHSVRRSLWKPKGVSVRLEVYAVGALVLDELLPDVAQLRRRVRGVRERPQARLIRRPTVGRLRVERADLVVPGLDGTLAARDDLARVVGDERDDRLISLRVGTEDSLGLERL